MSDCCTDSCGCGKVINAPVVTPVIGSKRVEPGKYKGSAAKVFFSPIIDAEHLIKLYNLVNSEIYGKVAIKLHTGEKHGPNILPRDLVQALQATIPNSNIVETNTLYEGDRYTTESHQETIKVNGWTFCPVDIMDEDGSVNVPVTGGFHLKEVAMGKNIVNYDSMLVLTHFKGHAMGGFGGSMKNIAIGCASGQVGKRQVHGIEGEPPADWNAWPAKEKLMELMADSAKATIDHFGKRITYINVMRNMSVDCDCAGLSALSGLRLYRAVCIRGRKRLEPGVLHGSDARSGICNDYRREHQNRSLGREVRVAERDRVAVAPQPGTV